MSRKVKEIVVSDEQKAALERGYKTGRSHCYRQRCKMVLLKQEGYRSTEIGHIVSSCEMSVNNWINRFITEGMQGLETKSGRGRKPVLEQEHLCVVKAAVQQERQRLSQAQLIIEAHIGKQMSRQTLLNAPYASFCLLLLPVVCGTVRDGKSSALWLCVVKSHRLMLGLSIGCVPLRLKWKVLGRTRQGECCK